MDKGTIRAVHRARRRQPPPRTGIDHRLSRELGKALRHFGVERPSVLAGYLPVPGEPDVTGAMAEHWRAGSLVVVPRTLPDHRLEWCRWTPSSPLVPDRHGLSAPQGSPLPDVLDAPGGVVLVPALAVDRVGHRIGQGGGYYDRSLLDLARWPRGPLRIAVVHPDEVLDGILPHDPHDAPVDAVLEQNGWFDCLAR